MDRNLLLATVLSIALVIGYYLLFPPPEPVIQQEASTSETTGTENKGQPEKTTIQKADALEDEDLKFSGTEAERKLIKVEGDLYAAEIDSLEGTLKSFSLKNYRYHYKPHFRVMDSIVSLFTGDSDKPKPEYDPDRLVNMAGNVSAKNMIWRVSTGTDKALTNFSPSAENVKLRDKEEKLVLKATLPSGLEEYKIFTFRPDSYIIDMELRLINNTDKTFDLLPRVNFGAGNEAVDNEPLPKPKTCAALIDEDMEDFDSGDFEKGMEINNASWIGVMDTYFLTAVKLMGNEKFNGKISPVKSVLNGDEVIVPGLAYADLSVSLPPKRQYVKKFQLFIGAKIHYELEKFDYYLPRTMDLGWFEFLSRPLLAVMRWLQSYVMNWGIAIILLTIIVRVAMFPIAYKGLVSMRKMSTLGPQIKLIREKHKNDKDRINKEIMNFYTSNKVNPMGGCLPMLVQIPIFIALYQALLPAIELRHTPFVLWMDDLSAADYTLMLPVLMGVTMFLQQSLTTSPGMDPTQAKIMKWLPVMMVFFFMNMPSGLVLYWVVSNILSIFQQLIFNKRMPFTPVPPQPQKGKSGKSGKQNRKSKR